MQKRSKIDQAKIPVAVEWPTLFVAVGCYLAFGVVTIWVAQISALLAAIALAFVLALHSSLQHEVLHGHPFRKQWLSDALIFPAIGVFVPYIRFRDTHLNHHINPNLTDPYDDPETNYLCPYLWSGLGQAFRAFLEFNNTLIGRMTVGPLWGMTVFYVKDAEKILRDDWSVIWAYVHHAFGIFVLMIWMTLFSNLGWGWYMLGAYGALSILRIRTFLEHQAHENFQGRSVIIEDRGLFAFLFLNNNFHYVHHAHPKVPWYRLPALYQSRREGFLVRNKGYKYSSYVEVFRHFFLRTKDPVPHPLCPKPPKD